MDAKLKEKISKLLAMQESPNENEAAIAAAKLSDLLTRYNLDMSELFEDSEEEVERICVLRSDRVAGWKFSLFSAVARVNYCHAVQQTSSGANGMYFFGRPTNVMSAKLLAEYLTQAVDRLAKKHCKGLGSSYANNFRIGCVQRISARLAEAHQQKLANGVAGSEGSPHVSAIVCVSLEEKRRQEIEAFRDGFYQQHKFKQGNRGVKPSGYGAIAGWEAGGTVSLSPQIKNGNQLKALGGA